MPSISGSERQEEIIQEPLIRWRLEVDAVEKTKVSSKRWFVRKHMREKPGADFILEDESTPSCALGRRDIFRHIIPSLIEMNSTKVAGIHYCILRQF